jgi:hypothetical protein
MVPPAWSSTTCSRVRSSFGDASGTAQGVPMELELVIKDLATAARLQGVAV